MESLNGGVGSRDTAAHVAENRALMAEALGVRPENFLSAYQIHSPDVVTVEAALGAGRAAARRRAGDARAGACDRRLDRGLRADPVRRRRARA